MPKPKKQSPNTPPKKSNDMESAIRRAGDKALREIGAKPKPKQKTQKK